MTPARWWLGSLLVGVLLAGGCGGPIPSTHYYLLEPVSGGGAARSRAGSAGLAIGVAAFAVDAPYDQDRLVYRVGRSSVEVGFYHYHRWATPLSRMLPQVIATGLAGTPGVRLIEPAAPGREYPAILDGRVLALEEVDTPEGPRVLVRISLTLRLADGTEIWTTRLDGEQSVDSEEVRELVEAVRDLLERIVHEVRPDLADALRGALPDRQAPRPRGAVRIRRREPPEFTKRRSRGAQVVTNVTSDGMPHPAIDPPTRASLDDAKGKDLPRKKT